MFAGKKNTNVNKHKRFAPNTGRAMTQLENLEADEMQAQRAMLERQHTIRKERSEMAYLQLIDPQAAQKQELNFMYKNPTNVAPSLSDKKGKVNESTKDGETSMSPPSGHSHKASVARDQAGAMSSSNEKISNQDPFALTTEEAHEIFMREQKEREKSINRARMARDDPMMSGVSSHSCASSDRTKLIYVKGIGEVPIETLRRMQVAIAAKRARSCTGNA